MDRATIEIKKFLMSSKDDAVLKLQVAKKIATLPTSTKVSQRGENITICMVCCIKKTISRKQF